MKNALIVVLCLMVLGTAGVVVGALFLNKAVKAGVETVGPKVAKTPVTLADVRISLLSGSGELDGFVVGNPEGFATAHAVRVGKMKMDMEPRSVLSDIVQIREISVDSPEIVYELSKKGSNLSQIMDNIKAVAGSEKKKPKDEGKDGEKAEEAKKMQIDDFHLRNGRVIISSTGLKGKGLTVPLPDLHLTDIGKKSNGATAAEVAVQVFGAVYKATAKVVGNQSLNKVKDGASGVLKGIKGLFN